MKRLVLVVVLVALGLWTGSMLASSCATSNDFREFAATQEKADLAIAQGFRDLSKGIITPAQAEEIVTKTVAKKNAETEQKIEKLEDRVLAWWQVICAGVGSAIPVVYAGMKLLDRRRNNTSYDRVANTVEDILKSKGLT